MEGIILAFVFILVCTLTDFKEKKIYGEWLGIFFVLGIIYCRYLERSAQEIAISMIPGVIVLIVSIVSHEEIGRGDGLMIINMGIMLGIEKNVMLLMISLFVCAIVSLFMIAVKKVGKKYEIPFAPFLMVALVIMTISG